jgi:hypothetical protein
VKLLGDGGGGGGHGLKHVCIKWVCIVVGGLRSTRTSNPWSWTYKKETSVQQMERKQIISCSKGFVWSSDQSWGSTILHLHRSVW